jgi:hypothetical protein
MDMNVIDEVDENQHIFDRMDEIIRDKVIEENE